MKHICKTALSLFCAALFATVAHADTFSLSATLATGSATGLIYVNGGNVTFGKITATDGTSTFTFMGAPDSAGPYDSVYIADFVSGFEHFQLSLPTMGMDLTGYTGGEVCNANDKSACPYSPAPQFYYPTTLYLADAAGNVVTKDDAQGGALTAATPEPSSIMLMGTGLLGLAGAARRKLKA